MAEIDKIAAEVYTKFGNCHIWAVHGEMGAGKTTFIHAICQHLGVTSSVSSPTYSIINEYVTGRNQVIYHMDWYRLKDEEEALQAGVEDCLLSGDFCMLEWVEKAPAILPDQVLHLYLSIAPGNSRDLVVNEMVK